MSIPEADWMAFDAVINSFSMRSMSASVRRTSSVKEKLRDQLDIEITVGLFVETKELFGCDGAHFLIKARNREEIELTRATNL